MKTKEIIDYLKKEPLIFKYRDEIIERLEEYDRLYKWEKEILRKGTKKVDADKFAGKSMTTKEMIEWLVEARASKYCWDEIDRKIVNAIIEKVEGYEELKAITSLTQDQAWKRLSDKRKKSRASIMIYKEVTVMSELKSSCHGAKVTKKDIMIPVGGSYSLREAYYCNKCNNACGLVRLKKMNNAQKNNDNTSS